MKFLIKIRKVFHFIFLTNLNYAKYLGVKLGVNCRLEGFNNFGSEPYLISIGNHVSITKSSFITHDGGVWVFREKHPSIDVVRPIRIGDNVFIGSNCTILPGVIIGNNVIVGAGSLVTKNLESNFVYGGVPAKLIKSIDEYWEGIQKDLIRTKGLSQKSKRNYLIELFNFK